MPFSGHTSLYLLGTHYWTVPNYQVLLRKLLSHSPDRKILSQQVSDGVYCFFFETDSPDISRDGSKVMILLPLPLGW